MNVTMLGASYRNQPATLGYGYAYAPTMGQDVFGPLLPGQTQADLNATVPIVSESDKEVKTSDGKFWTILNNIVDTAGNVIKIVKDNKTGQTGEVHNDPVTGQRQVVYTQSAFDINSAVPWIVGGLVAVVLIAGIGSTRRRR